MKYKGKEEIIMIYVAGSILIFDDYSRKCIVNNGLWYQELTSVMKTL